MSKMPNAIGAVKVLEHVHAHCLLMRDILSDHGGSIEGETLRGLAHVFENIMADLECAMGELDPA